jgi:hypothetical protein
MFMTNRDESSPAAWKLCPPPGSTGSNGPGSGQRKLPTGQGDPTKTPATQGVPLKA